MRERVENYWLGFKGGEQGIWLEMEVGGVLPELLHRILAKLSGQGQRPGQGLVEKRTQRSPTKVWSRSKSLSVQCGRLQKWPSPSPLLVSVPFVMHFCSNSHQEAQSIASSFISGHAL